MAVRRPPNATLAGAPRKGRPGRFSYDAGSVRSAAHTCQSAAPRWSTVAPAIGFDLKSPVGEIPGPTEAVSFIAALPGAPR
jgi:hypothetical protein